MKTYQRLSGVFQAYQNCIKTKNEKWKEKHLERIIDIMKSAPSGSGIDNGFIFDDRLSNPEKLVFYFGFHHMNENGMYDGWTDHKAIVTPSLFFGYNLTIMGRNKNEIKDYLHQTISIWLEEEID